MRDLILNNFFSMTSICDTLLSDSEDDLIEDEEKDNEEVIRKALFKRFY